MLLVLAERRKVIVHVQKFLSKELLEAIGAKGWRTLKLLWRWWGRHDAITLHAI